MGPLHSRHLKHTLGRAIGAMALLAGLASATLSAMPAAHAGPSIPKHSSIPGASAASSTAGIIRPCLACTIKHPSLSLYASHSGITLEGSNFTPDTPLAIEFFNADLPGSSDVILSVPQPLFVQTAGACMTGACFIGSGQFYALTSQAFDPCPGEPYAPLGARTIRAMVFVEDIPLNNPLQIYWVTASVSC